MNVRAKFICEEVALTAGGSTVSFSAATSGSEENDSFFKWTPSGNLTMGIINPEIKFEPGKEYYLDITLAE